MIDTHAHLNMFENNGQEIIDNMESDGLKNIVTIGTTIEDSLLAIEIAEKNENVYAVVGIYPEFAQTVKEEDFEILEKIAQNEKVVAIGEIGLDYHGDGFDKDAQRKVLVRQLEIADKLGLPFCIHCRDAVDDLYEILSENKNLINHSGLIHCYSEGKDYFKKFLELGMYISFSGNITYKKSDRSFLKDIPLDKILVETDSPYLSPEPLRGRRNEPKNVRHTIDKIAIELGMNPSELEKITEKNAKTFYFKIKNGENG